MMHVSHYLKKTQMMNIITETNNKIQHYHNFIKQDKELTILCQAQFLLNHSGGSDQSNNSNQNTSNNFCSRFLRKMISSNRTLISCHERNIWCISNIFTNRFNHLVTYFTNFPTCLNHATIFRYCRGRLYWV